MQNIPQRVESTQVPSASQIAFVVLLVLRSIVFTITGILLLSELLGVVSPGWFDAGLEWDM